MALQVSITKLDELTNKLEELRVSINNSKNTINNSIQSINGNFNETGLGLTKKMNDVLETFSSQVQLCDQYSSGILKGLRTMINETNAKTELATERIRNAGSKIDAVNF